MKQENDIVAGLLLNEECLLTLGELSRSCRVHAEWIVELVEQGIIEPHGDDLQHWRFPGDCLSRVQQVQRLQRDLGVNLAGAALALELLDEVRRLRRRLSILEQGLR
ncbi:chaperone modulator CbpM [Sedimenticola thiotaurini]|uniref:MerR family transcriptional regulator n=1 Tax=Sedimenticola thiotaurini TaxID=1543721 RepID=A0A0F7JZ12_9GAMM|nr:chaperone modulator CbpM [Sedimenticola thiotaurini]AKH20120.1 MerR family transcriptional regulator [Sedimenticola thiotaurini]